MAEEDPKPKPELEPAKRPKSKSFAQELREDGGTVLKRSDDENV